MKHFVAIGLVIMVLGCTEQGVGQDVEDLLEAASQEANAVLSSPADAKQKQAATDLLRLVEQVRQHPEIRQDLEQVRKMLGDLEQVELPPVSVELGWPKK